MRQNNILKYYTQRATNGALIVKNEEIVSEDYETMKDQMQAEQKRRKYSSFVCFTRFCFYLVLCLFAFCYTSIIKFQITLHCKLEINQNTFSTWSVFIQDFGAHR